MTTVTVSPKLQIVIPKEIGEANGIVSGQKIQMISYLVKYSLFQLSQWRT